MSSEICFSDCSVLNVTTCEELAPSKLHKVKHFTFYFCITQIAWCNCAYIFVGPSLNNLVSTKMAKYETNILHIQRQAEFNTSVRVCIFCILQESEKGQIFYWSIQTCTRIRLLFDWLIVTMLKKPQNCPISDFFDLTPIYFLSLLHYTDPVPPSSDPVPPSTKQYRPILTQYHHGSTITALYWSSATKYQQVEPHTDPVPSCINQYRLLLTQYHQVPTGTAFYWTNTIIYQPVPLLIDLVPLSINQYRPLLTQYHHISTSAAFHWPSTAKYQPVPLHTDLVPPSISQYQPILLLLGDYRLLHSLPWVLLYWIFIWDAFSLFAWTQDR